MIKADLEQLKSFASWMELYRVEVELHRRDFCCSQSPEDLATLQESLSRYKELEEAFLGVLRGFSVEEGELR